MVLLIYHGLSMYLLLKFLGELQNLYFIKSYLILFKLSGIDECIFSLIPENLNRIEHLFIKNKFLSSTPLDRINFRFRAMAFSEYL